MPANISPEHLADQLALIVQLDSATESTLKSERFSIADLAQDAVLQFTPLAEAQGVTITLLNPQRVPQVLGDIALIERALANLIDNALKHSEHGGRVEISSEPGPNANAARLSVHPCRP